IGRPRKNCYLNHKIPCGYVGERNWDRRPFAWSTRQLAYPATVVNQLGNK
ncbi:hypothetical protein ALC57_10864, partial [Trachymyrmex cornetzi]